HGCIDAADERDIEEEIDRDDDPHDPQKGCPDKPGVGRFFDRNGTDLEPGKRPVHDSNRRKQAGGGERGRGNQVFHPDEREKKERYHDQRDDLDEREYGFGLSRKGDPDDIDAAERGDYQNFDDEDLREPEVADILPDPPAAMVEMPKMEETRYVTINGAVAVRPRTDSKRV